MADARARDPFLLAVCALGVGQITAWGTAYYCLGVLANPIARDTGWSLAMTYLGFTIAMLTMGLVSPWGGRLIDKHGARGLMTLGILMTSAGMYAASLVTGLAAWFAVWAFLGVGMRFCLYDAAFAALVQVVPSRGRLAISYLTLFGAFASTVFWVLGHYLNERYGWRDTLAIFALINLVVCLPLNWIGLRHQESAGPDWEPPKPPVAEHAPLEGAKRKVAIILFAFVMSLNGFTFSIVTVQLVPLLEAAGLATAAAVWVASLKGFAQFGGRVVEIVFGRKLHAMTVARIAIGVLPPSFFLLYMSGGNFTALLLFTLMMGAAQGVITIVRGAVPLQLFGTEGYGAVLGLIATPVLIVNAASPTLFALLVERWGWNAGEAVLVAVTLCSWAAIELMSRWYEKSRRA